MWSVECEFLFSNWNGSLGESMMHTHTYSLCMAWQELEWDKKAKTMTSGIKATKQKQTLVNIRHFITIFPRLNEITRANFWNANRVLNSNGFAVFPIFRKSILYRRFRWLGFFVFLFCFSSFICIFEAIILEVMPLTACKMSLLYGRSGLAHLLL